jgi:hypothetical protein
MKYVVKLFLLLLLPLQSGLPPHPEPAYDFEGAAPSREEDAYYRALHRQVRPFVPASRPYIDALVYPQLTITRHRGDANAFTSVFELTDFRKRYEKRMDDCFAASRRDSTGRRSSSCLDSIRRLEYAPKIGPVPQAAILRVDSTGNRVVILYTDYQWEADAAGYWIAIRERGKWRRYYTGLTQNHFFFIKPKRTVPFLVNDSTVRAEAALVRQTEPGTLPVSPVKYELLEDGLVLTFHLAALAKDSDRDGITDVMEHQLFTDPYRSDTDGDYIPDGRDNNPLNRDGQNRRTILYKYLLEHRRDSCFLRFDRPDFRCGKKSLRRAPAGRTYCIVTEDSALKAVAGTRNRYLFMDRAQFERYCKTRPVPPPALHFTPLFKIDGRRHSYKITLGGDHYSDTYLVVEGPDGWLVRWIGGYVI